MTDGELIAYLLDCGLLSRRSVTDGSLRLVGTGGRNLNRRVTTAGGPAYVVKQGRTRDSLVDREARVYTYLGRLGDGDLPGHLPAVVHDDPGRRVLVLEDVAGEDLGRLYARRGRCPTPLVR